MECKVHDLGLIDYEKAWRLQDEYAAQIAQGTRARTLLLLEHPHVYTFGRRGQAENLLWNNSQLKEKNVSVFWVDRGGDVTYHGPGQLVGYPLIPLGKLDPQGRLPEADYVGYVRKLEKALLLALGRLGLTACQVPGLTGVWVPAEGWSRSPRCRPQDRQKPAKAAAIGVKVDAQGVTRHGFALNVNPDMSYWDGIIACGLADHPLTSLAEVLANPAEMARVKQEVTAAFGETFEYSMVPVDNPLDN